MKISEIIRKIEKWHEPFEKKEGIPGRDGILYGNPDTECTGIAVTVVADFDTLVRARDRGLNLVITHESIFYGNSDSLAPVYREKQKFITENNMVVYRDHDRLHGDGLPFFPIRKTNDFIFYGIMQELGWKKYVTGDRMKPLCYEIPETTARDLAETLMEKFGVTGMRVVGDLDARVRTVCFVEHVSGGKQDLQKMPLAEKYDALIPLEICDYTLSAYVKDEAYLNHDKVILEMGHFNVEQLGMKYMVSWLPEAIGDESIRVEYVPASDTYQYIKKGERQ